MGLKLKNKQVRIPYFIGLAWFISHPIVSVITGELKCRGMYVDEHQLDIPSLQTEPYELDQIRRNYLLEDTTSSSEGDEKFSTELHFPKLFFFSSCNVGESAQCRLCIANENVRRE